jgi:hypothetical protein
MNHTETDSVAFQSFKLVSLFSHRITPNKTEQWNLDHPVINMTLLFG